MTKVYSLYSAASQDAAAQIDIAEDGEIIGWSWAVWAVAGADGATLAAEISFGSQNSLTANDNRASIDVVRLIQEGTAAVNAINKSSPSGVRIPVQAGERIYLHTTVGTFTSGAYNVLLYVEQGSSSTRPSTRRR